MFSPIFVISACPTGMDTILKPRYLSNTESESSEEDSEDHSRKDSSASSRITVVPKEGAQQLQLPPEPGEPDQLLDANNNFFCPTAKYLQVTTKKVSSFDLLVRPAKRARFIVHPSRDDMSSGAFKQKISPVSTSTNSSAGSKPVVATRSPALECVYFENEKLRYRRTSSGSWTSADSSASPTPREPPTAMIFKGRQPPRPASKKPSKIPGTIPSLIRKLSEEHALRQMEAEEKMNEKLYGEPKGKNVFPAPISFPFYVNWTPSFQAVYREYEKERLTDENRNYLPNPWSKHQDEPDDGEKGNPKPPEVVPRKIIKATYRLRDLQVNIPPVQVATVFLKESDYDSLTELQLFRKDEQNRNKPPQKKRKFSPPEEEETSDRGSSPPQPKVPVTSIFRTGYAENSSTGSHGTPPNLEMQDEFCVIHHPDLRDFHRDSSNLGEFPFIFDMNQNQYLNCESPEKVESGQDEMPLIDEPLPSIDSPPFQMFFDGPVHDDSEIHFIHFGGTEEKVEEEEEEIEVELEESRIIDVTDLVEEEVESILSMGKTNSSSGGFLTDFQTILKARSSENREQSECSESRQLLLDNLWKRKKGKVDSVTEGQQQEVLMQPNPQLYFSNSGYSSVEQETTIKRVAGHTKSEGFAEKFSARDRRDIAERFVQELGNTQRKADEEELGSSEENSSVASPRTPQERKSTRLDTSSVETVLKKLSGGNRVGNAHNEETMMDVVADAKEVQSLRLPTNIQNSSSVSGMSEEPEKVPDILSAAEKSILKRKKRRSIFRKFMQCFCNCLMRSSRKVSSTKFEASGSGGLDENSNFIHPDGLHRAIAKHTDSVELLKERNARFRREQQQLYEETLSLAYFTSYKLGNYSKS